MVHQPSAATNTNTTPSPLMTVSDVVAHTRLARASIYRAMERGELVGLRIGNARRFRLSEVEAFIQRHERAGAEAPAGVAVHGEAA